MLAQDHDENGNPVPSGLDSVLLAAGPPWPFKQPELDEHMVLGRAPTNLLVSGNQRFIYELHPNGLGTGWALGCPGLEHAFQHIDPGVIRAVKQGQARLVINASWEAHDFNGRNMFEALAHSANSMGLDGGLMVLTSNLAPLQVHAGFPGGATAVHAACFFEHFMEHALWWRPERFATATQQRQHQRRARQFLCFNRRAHAHRQVLVSRLHQRGLLTRGLVSFPAPVTADLAWRPVPHELGATAEELGSLSELLPMLIDTEDFSPNHARTHPQRPYLDTWFSVVTETLFHETGGGRRFLSEKTFKPIANHHPFLLVSLPGSLACLRELGYRTFSPWINEQYDIEQDHARRLEQVVSEIHRLVHLSQSQWCVMMAEMMPVLEHNHRVLRCSDALAGFRTQLADFLGRDVARRR